MTIPYKQPTLAAFTNDWPEHTLMDMCPKCRTWHPDNRKHFCQPQAPQAQAPITTPAAPIQPQVALPVSPTPILANSHAQAPLPAISELSVPQHPTRRQK